MRNLFTVAVLLFLVNCSSFSRSAPAEPPMVEESETVAESHAFKLPPHSIVFIGDGTNGSLKISANGDVFRNDVKLGTDPEIFHGLQEFMRGRGCKCTAQGIKGAVKHGPSN